MVLVVTGFAVSVGSDNSRRELADNGPIVKKC